MIRLKPACCPHNEQGHHNRQGATDFGDRTDDEADKRPQSDFARLPHIAACQEFPDTRADERAEQQSRDGKKRADDTAD